MPCMALKGAQESPRTGSRWFHGCSKSFRDSPNVTRHDLKEKPREVQDRVKMVPCCPRNTPSWPQSRPGQPQRGPKKGSEQAQDVSMTAQDPSKMTHTGVRIAPQRTQRSPRTGTRWFHNCSREDDPKESPRKPQVGVKMI